MEVLLEAEEADMITPAGATLLALLFCSHFYSAPLSAPNINNYITLSS